jgi:hypothetical protein
MLHWLEDPGGETDPWKVESVAHLDQNGAPRAFALKAFRSYQLRLRVAEYVSASIAHELGIGAPAVELLTVTPSFLQTLARQRVRPVGLDSAQIGPQVGISWVENAVPLGKQLTALASLANVRQPAEIIATDAFLQNIDRHTGNILLEPGAIFRRADHRLIPIDWGLCMHGKEPGGEQLEGLQGATNMREYVIDPDLRRTVTKREDWSRVAAKLQEWSGANAKLRAVIGWMPPEWNVPAGWKDGLLDYFLRRIDAVLDRLEAENDSEGIFPNWQTPLTA